MSIHFEHRLREDGKDDGEGVIWLTGPSLREAVEFQGAIEEVINGCDKSSKQENSCSTEHEGFSIFNDFLLQKMLKSDFFKKRYI